MDDFTERATSPAFETRDAANEHATLLLKAYREAYLLFPNDSNNNTIASKPLYHGGPAPNKMHVLVKPVIA